VRPFRVVGAAVVLCLTLSGCLITTPQTVITVGRSNSRDVARAKRICKAVAVQHGLVLRVNDRGSFPEAIEYATPLHGPFGRYTSPELILSDSPQNSAVVVIGDWSDSAARRKLAEDTLAALQAEFGTKRVQRRDDRWTEF
jgi:hypothetical protein